jgi:hypothetical protein
MKQNILLIAYEKPVTAVEIAKALGIPTPYIEKAVEDLVACELMVRSGDKVATDFLISSPDDKTATLDIQLDFANELYLYVAEGLKKAGVNVKLGVFGADMKINQTNDGPFTVVMEK